MAWWQGAGWRLAFPAFAARLPMSGGGASAGGDPSAALIAALPEHIPALLRVATALVGTADAEDAAQEAILRAWQALGELRDPAALRPWLLRITVNVCRQWQRGGFGRRRRLMEPLPDEDRAPSLL